MSTALSISYTTLVEQLFLDLALNDVINKTPGIPVAEPWATMYVDSILDSRFGDAVWARYHIFGNVHNNIVDGSPNLTVLESIKEDAIGYRVHASEEYFEARPFYEKTSSADGHPDVIEIILDAASAEIPEGADEDEDDEEGVEL
ncbi:hypothetical protein QQX98_002599 [Neonectria punicea]|uniref:Uncharacterized protein n=1 Tax=Neonectria punicea TaxID=979145 RepID=A0ABR1HHW9_9HYPO